MENNEEQHGNKGSRLRLRTDRDFIANSFKMFRICFAFGMSVSKSINYIEIEIRSMI